MWYLEMHSLREIINLTRALRWPIAILLFIGGLLYCNSALFNAWASGGPPTFYPESYRRRFFIHLLISVIFFVLAGLALWKLKPKDHDE
jgi:hypothetical protein